MPLVGKGSPRTAAALDPAITDVTLQAFADTILPGCPASRADLGNPIHPLAIAGVDALPGAVHTNALALYQHSVVGFDALAAAFWPSSTRALCCTGAISCITQASGYRVMGLPGIAPNGYGDFSYRRKLSHERSRTGSLP